MTIPLARQRRSPLALAAVLLAAGLTVFGAAAPASAHDELLSSDPADGASLEALPAQITLTFSAELLDGGGNEIQVTDESGASLSDGAAVVDGTLLTQALSGTASGTVQVLWRAVSSDGHPISGELAFTVAAAPEPEPTVTETETAAPTPEATSETTPEPTMTILTTDDAVDEGGSPLPWIIVGIVVIAAGGAAVALLLARARRGGSGQSGSGPDAGR